VIVTSFPSLSTTTSTGSPIFTAPIRRKVDGFEQCHDHRSDMVGQLVPVAEAGKKDGRDVIRHRLWCRTVFEHAGSTRQSIGSVREVYRNCFVFWGLLGGRFVAT
jgi:hypothetical protein